MTVSCREFPQLFFTLPFLQKKQETTFHFPGNIVDYLDKDMQK